MCCVVNSNRFCVFCIICNKCEYFKLWSHIDKIAWTIRKIKPSIKKMYQLRNKAFHATYSELVWQILRVENLCSLDAINGFNKLLCLLKRIDDQVVHFVWHFLLINIFQSHSCLILEITSPCANFESFCLLVVISSNINLYKRFF